MSCACNSNGSGIPIEDEGYPGSVLDNLTGNGSSTTTKNNNQGLEGITQQLCTSRARCWVMLIAIVLLILILLRR